MWHEIVFFQNVRLEVNIFLEMSLLAQLQMSRVVCFPEILVAISSNNFVRDTILLL